MAHHWGCWKAHLKDQMKADWMVQHHLRLLVLKFSCLIDYFYGALHSMHGCDVEIYILLDADSWLMVHLMAELKVHLMAAAI